MRTCLLSMILILTLGMIAYPQQYFVLNESGRFNTPIAPRFTYTADVNGDNIKEIILADYHNVYVYSYPNDSLLWISPRLATPRDFQFVDANNDSIPDIVFRDSTNIYFYSGIDYLLIWSSPPLDSTFSCFTVGDYSGDGIADLVTANLEASTRHDSHYNLDTVWVDLYNGPSFGYSGEAILLMPNYWYGDLGYNYSISEKPRSISVHTFPGDSDSAHVIIVYAYTNYGQSGSHSVSGGTTGTVYLINTLDYQYKRFSNSGSMLLYREVIRNDSSLLCVIGEGYSFTTNHDIGRSYYDRVKLARIFSADTLVSTYTVWSSIHNEQNLDWGGIIIGDIDGQNQGDELCYAANSMVNCVSFPQFSNLWSAFSIIANERLAGLYSDSALFSSTQLLYGAPGALFSGNNGSLTGYVREPNATINYKNLADINNDGITDILYSINDTLRIGNHEAANDSIPYFIEHDIIGPPYIGSPSGLIPIDFNRDFYMDILEFEGGMPLACYENDMQYSFNRHTIGANGLYSIFPTDIDNDEDIDIYASWSQAPYYFWYENINEVQFVRHEINGSPGTRSYSISGLDINRDGLIDLIGAARNQIIVFQNSPNQDFTYYDLYSDSVAINKINVVDFNQDGNLDILALSSTGNALYWLEANEQQRFERRAIDINIIAPSKLQSCDLDNDGDLDIICNSGADSSLIILENDGSMVFLRHTIATGISRSYDWAAADFNNDNRVDIIVGTWEGNLIYWNNLGMLNFEPYTINTNLGHIGFMSAIDFNRDSDSDLIFYSGSSLNGNHICWWQNNSPRVSIPEDDQPPSLPQSFSLSQNYPNPFNPSTAIKYDLPSPCRVRIDIYDILGRRVATLVDEEQTAGTHQTIWNSSDKSSGIYFYRIQAGEFGETKKMLLVR